MTEKENIQNETQKDDTIRNVDMAEYVKKKKEEMTPAESIDPAEDIKDNNEEDEIILKPQTSKFEPKAELFRLPSGGVGLNPKYLTDGDKVYLRRTTTKEEDIIYDFIQLLLSNNDESNISQMTHEMMIMMDKVNESCLKTNIPISEFLMVDREAMFYFVVGLGYGKQTETNFVCEHCGEPITGEFDITKDIKINYFFDDKKAQYPAKIKLKSIDNVALEIRHLKCGETWMLFDNKIKQSELFKTITLKATNYKTGEEFDKKDIADIVTSLDDKDRKAIKNFFDKFNEIGITFEISKKLCKCGKTNKFTYPLQNLLFEKIKIKDAIV